MMSEDTGQDDAPANQVEVCVVCVTCVYVVVRKCVSVCGVCPCPETTKCHLCVYPLIYFYTRLTEHTVTVYYAVE